MKAWKEPVVFHPFEKFTLISTDFSSALWFCCHKLVLGTFQSFYFWGCCREEEINGAEKKIAESNGPSLLWQFQRFYSLRPKRSTWSALEITGLGVYASCIPTQYRGKTWICISSCSHTGFWLKRWRVYSLDIGRAQTGGSVQQPPGTVTLCAQLCVLKNMLLCLSKGRWWNDYGMSLHGPGDTEYMLCQKLE